MDEEDEPEALSGEEAVALARKGKDAWNTWAVENENKGGGSISHQGKQGHFLRGLHIPGRCAIFRSKVSGRPVRRGNVHWSRFT